MFSHGQRQILEKRLIHRTREHANHAAFNSSAEQHIKLQELDSQVLTFLSQSFDCIHRFQNCKLKEIIHAMRTDMEAVQRATSTQSYSSSVDKSTCTPQSATQLEFRNHVKERLKIIEMSNRLRVQIKNLTRELQQRSHTGGMDREVQTEEWEGKAAWITENIKSPSPPPPPDSTRRRARSSVMRMAKLTVSKPAPLRNWNDREDSKYNLNK